MVGNYTLRPVETTFKILLILELKLESGVWIVGTMSRALCLIAGERQWVMNILPCKYWTRVSVPYNLFGSPKRQVHVEDAELDWFESANLPDLIYGRQITPVLKAASIIPYYQCL